MLTFRKHLPLFKVISTWNKNHTWNTWVKEWIHFWGTPCILSALGNVGIRSQWKRMTGSTWSIFLPASDFLNQATWLDCIPHISKVNTGAPIKHSPRLGAPVAGCHVCIAQKHQCWVTRRSANTGDHFATSCLFLSHLVAEWWLGYYKQKQKATIPAVCRRRYLRAFVAGY